MSDALAVADSVPTERVRDAIAIRQDEMRRVRTFLVERKHVYQKFRTNPTTGVREAREKVDHAGLMEAWKLFGGKELKTDAPEAIACTDNGCPDALPGDLGFSVRAYAVNAEGASFSVAGHSCKHNAPNVRLSLREAAETKAIDRALSMAMATGLGNLAELPADEYSEWAAKWVVAPEACRKYFDGWGGAVNEHGHKWVKGGPRGYELHHRVDDGALPHPPALQKQLDALKLAEPAAWIKEGRGMNDAEYTTAIKQEAERLGVDLEPYWTDLPLEEKAMLFRKLSGTRSKR